MTAGSQDKEGALAIFLQEKAIMMKERKKKKNIQSEKVLSCSFFFQGKRINSLKVKRTSEPQHL